MKKILLVRVLLAAVVLSAMALSSPVTLAKKTIPDGLPPVKIKPLPGGLDENQSAAQRIALADEALQKKLRDQETGQPLRAEVFAVYPVSGDEAGSGHAACQAVNSKDPRCYRVDIYDWARNATVTAWVDVSTGTVLAVQQLMDSSPELPPHLAQRAIALAQNDPAVQKALARAKANHRAPDMARVRTSLNNTACELSRHLCVAPTFELGQRALWAIVDLTDERVVGVKWTDLGDFDADLPTESNLVKHSIYRDFCRGPVSLQRGPWRMQYQLTASDGLRLSSVTYRGQPVLKDARLVDYHVSYSNKDGFGYNDAIGCPLFSSAAVAAFSPPQIRPIAPPETSNASQEENRQGFEAVLASGEKAEAFEIVQDFRHPLWPKPCNYRYQQRYRFYPNGDFSVEAANLGRGCGAHAVYRFLFRIQPPDYPGQKWLKRTGGKKPRYVPVLKEYWQPWPVKSIPADVPPWRWQTAAFEYDLTPVFDPSEKARAYAYVVRQHADEGDSNLPTLGSCCNLDHRQGPESLIDEPPEPIDDGRWVLWYVPVIENDPTPGRERCWADTRLVNGTYQVKVWPCWAGLRFQRRPGEQK